MLKFMLQIVDGLGALKWVKSAKATLSVAGTAVILNFIETSTKAGHPWQVTVAGVIAVAVVTAALVIAQGRVDEAKALVVEPSMAPSLITSNPKEPPLPI